MTLKVFIKPMKFSSWRKRECALWPFTRRETVIVGAFAAVWLAYAIAVSLAWDALTGGVR